MRTTTVRLHGMYTKTHHKPRLATHRFMGSNSNGFIPLLKQEFGRTPHRSTRHSFWGDLSKEDFSRNVHRNWDTVFAGNYKCLCEKFSNFDFRCKSSGYAFLSFACPRRSCRKTHWRQWHNHTPTQGSPSPFRSCLPILRSNYFVRKSKGLQ